MIAIDHIGIMAHDAAMSAQFLGDILDLAVGPTGPDGDIYRLDIPESIPLLFSRPPRCSGSISPFASIAGLLMLSLIGFGPRGWCLGTTPKTKQTWQRGTSAAATGVYSSVIQMVISMK